MSRWFRMYADVLDDPKVQRLAPGLFKAWVNLLCLASRHDGQLPAMEDIAFALRLDENVTRDIIRDLLKCGLLEECDGLSPHNWRGRQFKSDADETATERKRKQRERDKVKENGPVTPPVTDHVTRDGDVTSHPPEQIRTDTEQSRADARAAEDAPHCRFAQDALDNRAADLTAWEIDFLISIKWEPTLTKDQGKSLRAIEDKLGAKGGAKPRALPTVTRGTPAYDAWIAHYRRHSKTGKTFHEGRDSFTVPTEFPPEEKAA